MRGILFDMRRIAVVLAFGCGPSSAFQCNDPVAIDAAPRPDGAAGACTGAVYDPCTSNDQCSSGICHLFGGDGIQVCTTSCTPGTACPMAGTVAITCNNMGRCKPPQANACTR